jgi:tRNA-dihydrouridine synthase C
VSVKMRLGLSDDARALDCARALEAGGADEIVVHARTRDQGYRPPVRWARVGDIRHAVKVPVIVNGDICTPDDARRARAESGCSGVMIGRGMVAHPGLARALHSPDEGRAGAALLPWAELPPLLLRYAQAVEAAVEPRHRAGRLKQWVQALRRTYPQAETLYQALRTENDSRRLIEALKQL